MKAPFLFFLASLSVFSHLNCISRVKLFLSGDRGKKLTPLKIALLSIGVAVVLLLVGYCVWRRKTADSRRGYPTVEEEEVTKLVKK